MTRNTTDFLKFGALLVVGFLLLLGVIIWSAVRFLDEPQCNQIGDRMGIETEYDFPAGCFVKRDNGTYIHVDNYVATEDQELN